ncbi:hypothetical protein HPB48_005074 [Haemaphysalis longicornis]|uniref:RING-type E3 ubiquitin transferase n=1 Tax=Haemaphysalis longicornis TaxID=44386 RepID=A0A9J6FFL8_HAELO|nr:hypothetical protein HPB48_005074 [Haemaphysalis longicornis]
MPKRLPIRDIVSGLLSSLGTAIRYWLHYTVVAFAWLGIVPLTACRIYRCLFTGSVSSLLTLPLDMLSTENLLSDSLYGCCIVTCTLCAFISLVWLREQVIHGEGPDWLEQDPQHLEGLAEADPGEVPGPPLGPVPHHAEEPPVQPDDHVAQGELPGGKKVCGATSNSTACQNDGAGTVELNRSSQAFWQQQMSAHVQKIGILCRLQELCFIQAGTDAC